MVHKKLLLSFVLLFFALTAFGAPQDDDAKKVKASLNEATVFFNGAELTHKVSSLVAKGANDVWITDLSPNIDINSLRINATKGAIIASHEFSLDYITPKGVSPKEKVLKDSVKYYQKKIKEYEISTKTNTNLLDLLEKNKSIKGAEANLDVSELMKMVEYYKTLSNQLNMAQSELEEKTAEVREALKRLESQLCQESIKNTKTIGVLKLNMTSPLATTVDFTISYFTKHANWIPAYDINVAGAGENIKIASKAKVAQTTGLNWNNVKLALSTATPSANKEAPLFNAWFLNYVEYSTLNASTGYLARQNSHSYDASVENVMLERVPGLQIRGVATPKSAKPLYVVNGVPVSEEEFQQLDSNAILDIQVLKDGASAIYGSRASDGVILITTKGLDDYVQRSEGELNAIYNIDLPYTIEGNGKVQSIDLQTHSVSAEFKHYAVPKLDKEVFILAEIADWQNLGLLSGKANVTFDGTYVGETVINANSVAKKLTLTLGTDKRVVVKREKLQDFSSQKFLGNTTQQDFRYKITVKNNQNKPISIVLKDQYPISNQKDIQVELLKDTTNPSHTNEEVGVLNWEIQLNAGETKEFNVAYRVKYPKDKTINL